MIIKYVNNKGISVNLNKDPYRMLVSDILDYEWDIIKSSSSFIAGFKKTIAKKSINIDIISSSGKSSRELMNALTDVFEWDVAIGIPGRIYIDDNYLLCYIYSSEKSNWETDVITSCEYGVVTDNPSWITEHTKSFTTAGSQSGAVYEFLDYPYDYDYDYAPDFYPPEMINIDHYADCKFLLKIYGPAIDPSVTINGIERKVYVTLEEGQYLLIDVRDKTVKRILIDGTALDAFDNRKKAGKSIFIPMVPGLNEIVWNHSFGFDLTIFKERSEPEWR